MDLAFLDLHIDNCIFAEFRTLVLSIQDSTRVSDIFIDIPTPLKETKQFALNSNNKIDIASLPEALGSKEIERGNGIVVLSEREDDWSISLFKQFSLNRSCWLIKITFNADKFNEGQVEELFVSLINRLAPSLATFHLSSNGPFDVAYYSSPIGLWAGLRDVYVLNYLGKEYSELIGKDKLISNKLFDDARELDVGVYFKVSKDMLQKREQLIESIGVEYFVKDRKTQGGKVEEKAGFIALMKTLYQLSRDEKDASADVHPFSENND